MWLRFANTVYASLSGLILLCVILANFWEQFPLEESLFSRSAVVGLLSLVSLLYSLAIYRYIAEIKPRLAGVISFILFTAAVALLIGTTNEPSHLMPLLLVTGLTSALHGWAIWIATLMSTVVYFLSLSVGWFDLSGIDRPVLWLGIISSGSVLSMLISIIAGSKGGSKKAKADSSGSGQIASDILINAIADGVAIINKSGQINIFNPSAQKITGWEGAEARGLDHHSIIIFVDQKGAIYPNERNPINKAFQTGKPSQDLDARLQTRSKKVLEVDVLASPIVVNEKTVAVVCIFRDVSKQRSEERQRAEFISTASHEMRTPVAAIEGYLALALNERVSKIDSTARGYLEKAHSSTQHLGKLFQDLLTAAKSEDGRLTNNPRVIETGQMLEELIEGAQFTAEKKGLILKSGFGANNERQVAGAPVIKPVAYVYADPERLREVITNLFDNAVKYTEEGSITIGMNADAKAVTISVADTGPGIPKEDINHLFQKFYRVDNSATRQIGGTGLGLFISRKIIELYSGRIWVESELGEGSVFYVSLPRLSAERAQELMKQEAQQSPLDVSGQTPQTPVEATQQSG